MFCRIKLFINARGIPQSIVSSVSEIIIDQLWPKKNRKYSADFKHGIMSLFTSLMRILSDFFSVCVIHGLSVQFASLHTISSYAYIK